MQNFKKVFLAAAVTLAFRAGAMAGTLKMGISFSLNCRNRPVPRIMTSIGSPQTMLLRSVIKRVRVSTGTSLSVGFVEGPQRFGGHGGTA